MLDRKCLAIWSALVKAINLAFYEKIPIGRQVASTVLMEMTTAYAAWQFPDFSIRELPSTNRVSWRFVSSWSRSQAKGSLRPPQHLGKDERRYQRKVIWEFSRNSK